MPPVYDQGQLGACTSFALGGAIQYDEMRQGIDSPLPSFLFIYYNERKLEGTVSTDSGASLADGIRAISTKGVANGTCWPYDIDRFRDKPPVECYNDASQHKALDYRQVAQTADDIQGVLAEGFPVVCGITVYQSFESDAVRTTGYVPMPRHHETVLGGHALLLVGYNTTSRYFIVRNSWNVTFGDQGYLYIPFDYILNADMASDFWVIKRVESPTYFGYDLGLAGLVPDVPVTEPKILYI